MAQSDMPSFDELETVDTTPDDADDDAEWLDLEAGEDVVGEFVRSSRTAASTTGR